MTTPKLEKIWIAKFFDGRVELLLDWSKDYHLRESAIFVHAFVIRHPHGPEQIANALREAAIFLDREVVLNKNAPYPLTEAGRKE